MIEIESDEETAKEGERERGGGMHSSAYINQTMISDSNYRW